ncbi:Alanine--tRNA ligase [Bertholletia excelsa]
MTTTDVPPTKLDYYDSMWKLNSTSTILSHFQGEDGRYALVLESTIFYPQGGGQPSDSGFITVDDDPAFKFVVHDVRSKDGIVFHYGFAENYGEGVESKLQKGVNVLLYVDESRRKLNSRLHSAGHLLDICMRNVGLGHLEPAKGYHFPDGPFVEYKGTVAQNEPKIKPQELEMEANKLISKGGKVSAATLSYEEASELCSGSLPDYIAKGSTPRIVKLGDNPGCPCGGTHVSDVSEITSIKVSQMRTKKGMTKIFYNVES